MRLRSKFAMMKSITNKKNLGLIVLCTIASTSYALPSDRQQPIKIQAENSSANTQTGVITASGNILIEQGTLKLEASSISTKNNAQKQISEVTIQGSPAKFQQQIDQQKGLARGEAKKILYNIDTGIITLSGNALLTQEGKIFRGETLRYSMNKGDVEASGGGNKGRITIVIPPSAKQSFSGVRD